MGSEGCVAMILAGGRGERLGGLTRYYSKPAIPFGGNHRIIDFTLSNCYHAGIGVIGILGQYFTTDLHEYLGMTYNGVLDSGSVRLLPSANAENSYTGTADAVYKNIGFIDKLKPANVLILSGDHVYKMNYNKMINFHEESGADVTIASTPVSFGEASRYGILNAAENGQVLGFEEKPPKPKSNLASMGVYIFKWSALKKCLLADSKNRRSQHDFGKNIIPGMLSSGMSVGTYRFNLYWRDVGTVDALWEANMDQIDNPTLRLDNKKRTAPSASRPSRMLSCSADISQSIIYNSCIISGRVEHSVLSESVTIEQGAEVVNSVIMPNAYVGSNAKIYNAVVGTGAVIMKGAEIGSDIGSGFFIDRSVCSHGVSLVAPWLYIAEDKRFLKNSHIHEDRLNQYNDNMAVGVTKSYSHIPWFAQ